MVYGIIQCHPAAIVSDRKLLGRSMNVYHVSGIPSYFETRKSLNFGFSGRLDGESAGWGSDASAEGAI